MSSLLHLSYARLLAQFSPRFVIAHLRNARQKNLDWIELPHELIELGADGNCR